MSVTPNYTAMPMPNSLVRDYQSTLLADKNLPEAAIAPLPMLAPKLPEGRYGFAVPLIPIYREKDGTYKTLNTELHPGRTLTVLA
jgi:hypothetical protein